MTPTTPLILASASPRRRELLAYLGVPFAVLPSSVDELIPKFVNDPASVARDLARSKATDVAGRNPSAAVLAADTIVVLDGQILGKPADQRDASETLRALRNRPHQVITALALAWQGDLWIDHACTSVCMRDYSDQEIESYIASGDPFDKAGSYAIQSQQFRPVDRCEGCYCNVVGLPLVLVRRLLEQASFTGIDVRPPDLPPECDSCPLLGRHYRESPRPASCHDSASE